MSNKKEEQRARSKKKLVEEGEREKSTTIQNQKTQNKTAQHKTHILLGLGSGRGGSSLLLATLFLFLATEGGQLSPRLGNARQELLQDAEKLIRALLVGVLCQKLDSLVVALFGGVVRGWKGR